MNRARLAPLLAPLAATFVVPAPAAPQEGPALRSPTVRALADAVAGGDTVATGAFWREVGRRGTPLAEPLAGADSTLFTFLWRGDADTRRVTVFGPLTGWLPPGNVMERVLGTDVWVLSVAASPEVVFSYRVAENDPLVPYWRDPDFGRRLEAFRADPLNADTVALAPGRLASRVVGPAAPTGPWDAPVRPRAGTTDTLRLGDRAVVLYRPPAAEGADDVGLVVALDGPAYERLVSTPAVVESLTGDGTVPPTAVALVPHEDRTVELPPNEPFLRFVADTLLPAVEARLPLASDPARHAVAGSSLGGLAALWLGYRLPNRFGNVVAQSGAYWWAPPGDAGGGWLPRLLATTERRPIRVYLDVGELEWEAVRGGPSMRDHTRHVRDVLCARGYAVAFRSFPGGHEYEHWRRMLPGGLAWALAGEDLDGDLQGCVPPALPGG